MKLASFIRTNMERLLHDWEKAAVEIAPELAGESRAALRDHARSMLEFIRETLSTSRTKEESVRTPLGKDRAPASAEHAMDRVGQGLSTFQMVQEFGALRARVTRDWSDKQRGLTGKDINELVLFNETVDQLLANSVSSFAALKDQETRLTETLLKATPDPAAIFDPDGKYRFINKAMAELIDATHEEIIGKTPLELGLGLAPGLHDAICTCVATGQTQRREYHHCPSSGRELYLDCQLVPVCNARGDVEAVVKTSRDITERKQTEYQDWRNANFDVLTGLPNRRLFIDRLEQTLLEAERKCQPFALLFIDLDLFKQANDRLGHRAGDELLAKVAERMSAKVRGMDTLARLGGDEFTLILKETGIDGAKHAAKVLLSHLEEVFDVDSHHVHLSGSIGLAVFPDHGKDVDQLMHNADMAMYAAKEHGGNQVQLYEPSMVQSKSEGRRLSRELEEALRKDQLEVYYQPIIDIRTGGAILRAEALLRWNHPDKGLLTPAAFLDATGQNGVTDSLTAYVLAQAVTHSLLWRNVSGEAFPININESPASFMTRSLVEQWQTRLAQIGLDESKITLELTPASLNNLRAASFNPVKSLGLEGLRLHLAADDFGIEPFSLLTVQEFRMDSIKIDRELIKNAGEGGDADEILEALIAMAHAINIKVVAVGVEKVKQLHFLASAGCDYAQGFLFSRPLCPDDFGALLKQNRQIRPA